MRWSIKNVVENFINTIIIIIVIIIADFFI